MSDELWCDARHPLGLICDIPKGVEHQIHEETFVGMWIGDGPVSWYQGASNGKRTYAPDHTIRHEEARND